MKKLPETDQIVFEEGNWKLHRVDVQSKKGEVFPKLYIEWPNSVMVFPLNEKGELVLIKEYCKGADKYEIHPPKGKMTEARVIAGWSLICDIMNLK